MPDLASMLANCTASPKLCGASEAAPARVVRAFIGLPHEQGDRAPAIVEHPAVDLGADLERVADGLLVRLGGGDFDQVLGWGLGLVDGDHLGRRVARA